MDIFVKEKVKLLIELKGGDIYESMFVEANHDWISVRNVSEYPKGIVQDFPYKFYKEEIVSLTALLEKGEILYNTEIAQRPIRQSTMLLQDFEKLKHIALNFTYLPVCDSVFLKAIERISSVDVIAVYVEGAKFGRCGKISLITIATKVETFIFDIDIAKTRPFYMGLKDIFESKAILKIIYGSRTVADCLKHCYDTRLNNVADPQVMDYLVIQKKTDFRLKRLHPFKNCVPNYLLLPSIIISKNEFIPSNIQSRPLTEDQKICLTFKTAFLFPLEKVLKKIITEDFMDSGACYANSVRSKCEEENLHVVLSNIPEEFRKLCLKTCSSKTEQQNVLVKKN